MLVDLTWLRMVKTRLAEINALELKDIQWLDADEKGRLQDVTYHQASIDQLGFMGMKNTDLPELFTYKGENGPDPEIDGLKSCIASVDYFDIQADDVIYFDPDKDIECIETPKTHKTIHRCVLAGSAKIHYMFSNEVKEVK